MKRTIVAFLFAFNFIFLSAQNPWANYNDNLQMLDQTALDSAYEAFIQENPELKDNQPIKALFTKGHLTFKGIEIDGSLDDFYNKLKKEIPDLDGVIFDTGGLLKGTFAGKRGCTIILRANTENTVMNVGVTFPAKDSWNLLKDEYDDLCLNLKLKYGEPAATLNKYEPPFKEGDGRELQGLLQQKVSLAQFFLVDNGYIQVSLIKAISTESTIAEAMAKESQGAVTIYYHDYKNNMTDEYAKYNDL